MGMISLQEICDKYLNKIKFPYTCSIFFFEKEELLKSIDELKTFANPCMKCGSVMCAICWEDIEKLKRRLGIN